MKRRGSGSPEVFRSVALAQGAYYLFTALWSLVSVGTFQKVTGPKTDVWLVKTVGVLVGVIGAVLGVAGVRRRRSSEMELLGAGSAGALAIVNVYYVAKGRISRVYLLDALAELVLAGCWACVRYRRR